MSRRRIAEPNPRRRLADARARAEAATAARLSADARAERAARVDSARARLALADARRAARPIIGAGVYARLPTPPTLDALAARARRWPSYFADEQRHRLGRAADALAAVPEMPDAYDWEMTPHA